VKLNIKTDFRDVQRKLDALQKDIATKALARAVNRTMEQAQTAMAREIKAEYNLPSIKMIRERLRLKRAAFAAGRFGITATLESNSPGGRRSLNVIHFAAKKNKVGTSVKIKRIGPRKTIPSAFIGNKGRTVFKRVGKSRLPIAPVQTIDVPGMFGAKRINSKIVALIKERFPKILEREIAFYSKRFNGR
jgi:hypothetical protein